MFMYIANGISCATTLIVLYMKMQNVSDGNGSNWQNVKIVTSM